MPDVLPKLIAHRLLKPDRFYERSKTYFAAAQIDGEDTATHLSKAERDVQNSLQLGSEKWRSRKKAVELLRQIQEEST